MVREAVLDVAAELIRFSAAGLHGNERVGIFQSVRIVGESITDFRSMLVGGRVSRVAQDRFRIRLLGFFPLRDGFVAQPILERFLGFRSRSEKRSSRREAQVKQKTA